MEVLTREPKEQQMPEAATEPWLRLRFTIAPPLDRPDAFEPLRVRCKALVDQRNDLVHHFLRRFAQDEAEDLLTACRMLDAQHEEAGVFRNEIAEWLREQQASREQAAAWIASPEFADEMKDAVAQGRVAEVLLAVAATEHRRDGWTFLTTAQHRLRERVPLDVKRLCERLGSDWLFRTVAMLPVSFEAQSEPLPNGPPGATRIVYRVLDGASGA